MQICGEKEGGYIHSPRPAVAAMGADGDEEMQPMISESNSGIMPLEEDAEEEANARRGDEHTYGEKARRAGCY